MPTTAAHARTGSVDLLRVAVSADEDPRSQTAHEATLRLLDRIGAGDVPDGGEWFPDVALHQVGQPGWALRLGVTASMLGVCAPAGAEDFVTVSRLVEQHGHRRIAGIQGGVDALMGAGASMPLASRAMRAMADAEGVEALLRSAGVADDEAAEVATRNATAAFWLVVGAGDVARPGPVLRTPDEVADAWHAGGVPAWRGQVALIAANPWTPYGPELRDLALAAGLPAPARALELCMTVYRTRLERQERDLVAREIRELVACSGLSQREFARMLGTSASRLSTYVNGLVTPSATLMLRIRRVSDQVRTASSRPSASSMSAAEPAKLKRR